MTRRTWATLASLRLTKGLQRNDALLPMHGGIGVCMDRTLHILVADFVPIADKGEEAIIRGIEDMLSQGRPVALGLFDNISQVTRCENLTLFPRDWLFRFEGDLALSGRGRILRQASIALQLRLGIYGPLQNLANARMQACRPLADLFHRARYVLVGHDGVFGVESCGIVHPAREYDKRTHSLIGRVSAGTPFAVLTNRQDTRTHGIIGAMCRGSPGSAS